jgi:serine/threonine protein kinase
MLSGAFVWSAPEVLMGAKCSHKVDIYSFGVILWELITGESPQRGRMRSIRWATSVGSSTSVKKDPHVQPVACSAAGAEVFYGPILLLTNSWTPLAGCQRNAHRVLQIW